MHNERRLFMKKILSIFIITIVLGISSIALAEKPSVTIGLKTWVATGELDIGDETYESDYGLMYGPGINVRYQNFFGGISYLLGSFSFPELEDRWIDSNEDGFEDFDEITNIDFNADRKDLDLSVGYYFHPNIALLLGYKMTDFDYTSDLIDFGSSYDATETRKGPVLGVVGNYRIGESRWSLFGNLSYVMLDSEFKPEGGDTEKDDIKGPAIEFGAAYAAENIPLSVSVGYKYQSYEYGEGGEDIFGGLTFGVNYTL